LPTTIDPSLECTWMVMKEAKVVFTKHFYIDNVAYNDKGEFASF
jgi:hypothetical protein